MSLVRALALSPLVPLTGVTLLMLALGFPLDEVGDFVGAWALVLFPLVAILGLLGHAMATRFDYIGLRHFATGGFASGFLIGFAWFLLPGSTLGVPYGVVAGTVLGTVGAATSVCFWMLARPGLRDRRRRGETGRDEPRGARDTTTRGVPFVRELRWSYTLPQFVVAALFLGLSVTFIGYPNGFLFGATLYASLSFGLRQVLARHHRDGVRRVLEREWAEALPCFEQSQVFIERYPWLDRYRQIFLLSPSGASYHEMALVNRAFCLIQLDRVSDARRLYEQTLARYPDSPIAEAALKTMAPGEAAARDEVSAPG